MHRAVMSSDISHVSLSYSLNKGREKKVSSNDHSYHTSHTHTHTRAHLYRDTHTRRFKREQQQYAKRTAAAISKLSVHEYASYENRIKKRSNNFICFLKAERFRHHNATYTHDRKKAGYHRHTTTRPIQYDI